MTGLHATTRGPGTTLPALGACAIVGLLLAPVLIAVIDAGLQGVTSALVSSDNREVATTIRLFDPAPAIRGFLVAAGIATLAVLVALPVAISTASRRWAWSLLAAPMLMPPYLAYSGWGVIRDPTWMTGRWIIDSGLAGSAPKTLAFVGLALWSWPIAAMIVSASVRGRDTSIADALSLEPVARLRRVSLWLRVHRGAIVTAWVAIGALMLGSAVPLHLAQFQTGAVRVWLLLDQTAASERWRVWFGSWPLLLGAAIATVVLTSTLVRDPDRGSTDLNSTRVHRHSAWASSITNGWTLLAVGVSVLVPLGLFAMTLGRADALTRFVDRAGGSITTSASIAAGMGLGAVALCALTAWGAGSRSGPGRFLAVWTVRLSVFGALVPGVLVGEAWVRMLGWAWLVDVPLAGGALGDLRDQPLSIALAQGTRLVFVPVLAGWWIARREPRGDRDARAIDRAEGALGWWLAWGARWTGLIVGAGAATMALSLHEIEATVLVQPPGVDVLARLVLDDLHFERPDQRSAAGLMMMLGALIPSLVVAAAVWMLAKPDR